MMCKRQYSKVCDGCYQCEKPLSLKDRSRRVRIDPSDVLFKVQSSENGLEVSIYADIKYAYELKTGQAGHVKGGIDH